MQHQLSHKNCSFSPYNGHFLQNKKMSGKAMVIFDKKKRSSDMEFHIASQEYFGNLATIISLLREERKRLEEKHQKIMEKIILELADLQKNYEVVEKKK